MGRDDSWPATVPSMLPTGGVPTDPFTRPTGPFRSEWAKYTPENTQNGETLLPIVNLMAESESGSPVSYSNFLATIRLISVSEILACNGSTDRRTTRTISIAGPHILAGQLIKVHSFLFIPKQLSRHRELYNSTVFSAVARRKEVMSSTLGPCAPVAQ